MRGILPDKVRLAGRHGTLEALHYRGVAEQETGTGSCFAERPRSSGLRRYVRPDWLEVRCRDG